MRTKQLAAEQELSLSLASEHGESERVFNAAYVTASARALAQLLLSSSLQKVCIYHVGCSILLVTVF